MKMETELSLITINCWGIKYVSRNRVERFCAIGDELSKGEYDFVFLQEVWSFEDYERIKNKTCDVLPYSHYFPSGVIGSGLCIFSKSPILNAYFNKWAVNGYIHKIQHGDWFGGKGIAMVQVLHRGLKINLYTAHLHAEYDRVYDEYLAHRVIQAFDTAQFISLTSQAADIAILGGDLNTEPGDLAYRIITHKAQLKDCFFEAVNTTNTEKMQYTCETQDNSYTSRRQLKSNPFGKRIDYIAFKTGELVKATVLNCDTPWPSRVPNKSFSYSDHEPVVARMRILKSTGVESIDNSKLSRKEALEEGVEVCSEALSRLNLYKKIYLFFAGFFAILLFLSVGFNLNELFADVIILFRFIFFFSMLWASYMGTIWNLMEVNGIMAAKFQMVLELGGGGESNSNTPNTDSEIGGGGDISGWTITNPSYCNPEFS